MTPAFPSGFQQSGFSDEAREKPPFSLKQHGALELDMSLFRSPRSPKTFNLFPGPDLKLGFQRGPSREELITMR
jgi:hypothetical protein